MLSTRHHQNWAGVLAEVAALPPGTGAVVWLRRADRRGRESVGHLYLADNPGGRARVVDPRHPTVAPRMEDGPHGLLLIAYRAVPVS